MSPSTEMVAPARLNRPDSMRSIVSPADLGEVATSLRSDGWGLLPASLLQSWLAADATQGETLHKSWNDLPPDTHLRDGGHYRFRRHSCFTYDAVTAVLTQTPHRGHWQPVTYNALHGGFERWFEPVRDEVTNHPMWRALLSKLGQFLAGIKPVPTWSIEAHQFRVDTTGGIGRPTPEGAHRDGVDFVAVVMLERHGIKGGETRVFEAHGPQGVRFTLEQPWSTLLLDDERVIHESTPIQPLGDHGWRDTLVLTFRQGGFQGP
jgi:hypothetical protein